MLWRLYVIWNKSVKVSVPPVRLIVPYLLNSLTGAKRTLGNHGSGIRRSVLLLLIYVSISLLMFEVCGYITIYHLSTLSLQPESIQALYRWLQASYSLSLATQLSVTTMIVARIWWMSKRTGSWKTSPTSKPYVDIIWMIVESGAISAITSTLFLAFFNTDATISIILGDSLGQISVCYPFSLIQLEDCANSLCRLSLQP